MFAHRFFPARFFAPRYFPPVSAVALSPDQGSSWMFPQHFLKPEDMDDDAFILLVMGVLLSE